METTQQNPYLALSSAADPLRNEFKEVNYKFPETKNLKGLENLSSLS